MDFRRLCVKCVVPALIVCLVLAGTALGIVRWKIQAGLDEWCVVAQAAHPHPGDDVAALLDYVQSDVHSLQQRNHAVWALGQARDRRALPVLQEFVTHEPCDHDRPLCQHELGKAIALCKGETPNLLHIQPP